MADVTLEMLGQMVQRVLNNQHDHSAQLKEVTVRLSQLEQAVSSLHRDGAIQAENTAVLHARIDRLSDRIERIERRLDLTN
jgi:hypothetical protein